MRPARSTTPHKRLRHANPVRGTARTIGRVLLATSMLLAGAGHAAERTLANDTWNLLVVPGDVANRRVSALLGDALPMAEYTRRWTVFTFDAGTGEYGEPAPDATLGIGEGFWVIQRTGRDVTLDADTFEPVGITSDGCASSAGCIEASLPTRDGAIVWHLLGAPVAGEVPVADLHVRAGDGPCRLGCDLDEAATAGMTTGRVWTFDADAGAYNELSTTDTLQPWQGFLAPIARRW